jgi:hypothetical protein
VRMSRRESVWQRAESGPPGGYVIGGKGGGWKVCVPYAHELGVLVRAREDESCDAEDIFRWNFRWVWRCAYFTEKKKNKSSISISR